MDILRQELTPIQPGLNTALAAMHLRGYGRHTVRMLEAYVYEYSLISMSKDNPRILNTSARERRLITSTELSPPHPSTRTSDFT